MIIVISGASSAGKTTLAQEIQSISKLPFLYIEADRSFPSMTESVHRAFVEQQRQDDLILTFHRSVATWGEHDFNVLLDGSLPYGQPQLRAACLNELRACDLRVVAVDCAPDVLTGREKARADRVSGWGATQLRDIHDQLTPDAHVDSSASPPSVCAQTVLEQLGLTTSPSA